MNIRWWRTALLVAVLLVPASSFLGLSARILFEEQAIDDDGESGPAAAWRFFAGVWTGDYTKDESAGWTIVADATFIAATVAALAAAILVGARFHPGLAALAGLAANWLAYYLSYGALLGLPRGMVTDPGAGFRFVWEWGWPGLAFCGFAAAGMALRLRAIDGAPLWAWDVEAGRQGPAA